MTIPLVLIAAGLVGLLAVGVLEGGVPEIQARELAGAQYRDQFVKVHGLLDSIESNERPLRFTIRDKERPDVKFEVIANKSRPDTFQENYDVSVEGRWDAATGRFEADKILTKCPSKYEAEAKDGIGSQQMLEQKQQTETAPQAPQAPQADSQVQVQAPREPAR